jgi:O-antigen/teichoic acid export membrane protein
VVFGLAALRGTAELGRLRAAQLLLGPATTMLVAFNAFVLPRLASRAQHVSSRQALQLCAVSAGASGVAVGLSVVAAPLVEQLFFGDELDVSLRLVVVVGVAMVLLAASAGIVLHLKALRDLGPHTVVRGCIAVLSVPLVLGAARAGGLDLAVFAMLLQAALAAAGDVVAWRYTLRRRARRATGTGSTQLS